MVNLLSPRRGGDASGDTMSEAELAGLAERLREARAWASTRPSTLPVASRLRTEPLAPDLEEVVTPASLQAALFELCTRRRAALDRWDPIPTEEPGGRLLICEIDMSISDGRSEAASQGFFDVDDRPPWDTWIAVHARTRKGRPDEPITRLIAWVPDALVRLASAGIEANRSRTLYWARAGADGLAGQLADLAL